MLEGSAKSLRNNEMVQQAYLGTAHRAAIVLEGWDTAGKGGVVRDPAVHARVCDEVVAWLEASGWRVGGVTESPITGPEGNVEFLVAASRNGP